MDFFDKMKKYFLLVAVCMVCLGQLTAQNVAKIGSDEYATLQAAVDAAYNATYATPTNVTIELIADIEAYTVIKQKEGLNLTIDGNNKAHTITGQIFIDGCNRSTGTETLTITGIIFTGDGTGAGFYDKNFISMPNVKTPTTAPYYHNVNNYAHNVTVSNCSFISTSASKDMVGVRVGSKGGGGYNTVVIDVEGDNLHSLGQFAAANGTTITNCSATNTISFINFGDGGNVTNTISNCTFSSSEAESYAVREKGNSASDIVLSNNNFTAENVIWLGENDAPSGTISVESGTYYGSIYNGMNASGTGEIVLTGGTFTEDAAVVQGYCAYGYEAVASDPAEDYCTVRKLEVAQVGTTTYPSLQDAVTAAYELDGAVTIELLKNTSEVVVVCQQPGQQLTINGQDNTLTGQIIINYGRNATDNTAATSITNMNFVYDENYYNATAGKYLIALPANAAYNRCDPSYTGSYNSSHNITVSNCTFDGGGSSNGVAAFHVGSSSNGIPNITLDHLTVANAHSLVQIQGGVNGLSITNCKAVSDVKNGINITGGVGTITITNDTITTLTDGNQYALRLKGNSTGAREAVLTDNQFIAPRAFEITNTSAGTTLSISSGRYEGAIYRTGTDVSEFSFTGGTFDQPVATVQNWCAEGYAAFDDHNDSPHTCTVYPAAIVHFDANGGEGTMDDTIAKKGEPYVIPECQFTPVSPYNFAGWKDMLGNSYNVGETITLIQDTTFVAQWSLAKTITYHSNFGTDATLIQTKLDDETVTLYDATTFEWVGHNLVGWNTQADGNGTPYELGASYSTNENLILYAVWELKPCPNANTVSDIDGNTYNTVRIGSKYLCWMSSSLKSNRYSNGREIKNVMQYPVNTRATVNGNLYDWYAVVDTQLNDNAAIEAALAANTSIQGVCPTGYHIPTEEEVTDLMSTYDPRQLMSAGWLPDSGTNESGFNMLPSGSYNSELNRYERMYVSAYFWILTPPTYVYHACEFGAACSTMELVPGSLTMGFSVRCIANE